MEQQHMSFYGASIKSDGKVFALGEDKTEVTITRASLQGADRAKPGQRVFLWAAPPGTEDWSLLTSFRVGGCETVGLKLCIPFQGEIQLKVTPKKSCGIDLVGYQSLPEAFGVEGGDHPFEVRMDEADTAPGKKRKAEEAEDAARAAKQQKAQKEAAERRAREEEARERERKRKEEEAAEEAARKAKAERAAAKPKHEPDFIAAKKFAGSKPGYVFKKDGKGLGYYKDVPPKVAAKGGKKSAADQWADTVVQQQQWRKGPGGIKMRDSVVGKGTDTPRRGRRVTVHYTGKLANGRQFDSSVGRAPFSFVYGGGEVIKGWDMGLDGMRVGGTRELELPPAMGYGARGAPPDIPRNATLKFTVQLLKV